MSDATSNDEFPLVNAIEELAFSWGCTECVNINLTDDAVPGLIKACQCCGNKSCIAKVIYVNGAVVVRRQDA